MISPRKLSNLLASLHSAPLEEANWQAFFDGLCDETHAMHGLFLAAGLKQGTAQILAQGGRQFNAEMQRQYNEYFWRIDPYWNAYKQKPRVGVIAGEELVTPQDVERSEFYNDLAVPTGVQHAVVVPAIVTPHGVEAISLWRGTQQEPFEKSTLELLKLLLPHIQAALKTRRALALANVRASRSEAALDAAASACFILHSSGKVLHLNQSAEELIQRQVGLKLVQNRLVANETVQNRALQALVASAASAGGAAPAQPGGMLALHRAAGQRPLYVTVLPLRLPVATAPTHVLVLVTDPESTANYPEAMLKELFGLTPAEAEIANALLAGFSVDEIAELRRVTPGTLRIQLKTIFQKTNTRRQSELIRLLQSLPRPLSKF